MMPRTYARIHNGIFAELILPAFYDGEHPDRQEGDPSRIGDEIPIDQRFPAQMVDTMVDITDMNPQPQPNWTYVDGVFAAPVPPVIDPSIEKIARMNQIDSFSVKLLRKAAIGVITEQELEVLELLDEEYTTLENGL